MQTVRLAPFVVLFSLLGLAFFGCTAAQVVEDVKPTAFISRAELLHKPESTPFDLAWMADGVSSWQYDTLIVEAVRTNHLATDNWIFRAGTLIPTRDAYMGKVNELATYVQKTVSDHFEDYDDKVTEVYVEKKAPVELIPEADIPMENDPQREVLKEVLPNMRTLVVELSIAEANFGDPLIYGGLLAVPLPGVANLSTAAKSPSLTLEARLIDQDSGRVITELVDRRFPQVKIVDINRLTISSALHELADSFAHDLVESFYRNTGEKVSKRSPFSLLPW